MAQPSEQPALDHEDRLLDLGLVPWPSWPGRQNGGAVMRRHIGVAAVDLRIVEAGLDHRDLGVVRHQQCRHAADRLEGADVPADPVGEALRPGRLRVGDARCAEHRDENLRGAPLAGEPVDHHRHAVARIVDEQLLAGRVRLAHRHRQPAFPGPVELAEPRIAIPAGFARDVLLPHNRQRHVLALELAMHRRPVRLGLPPMAPPGARTSSGAGEQPGLQHRVGDVAWQRPGQPRRLEPADRQPHRRRGRADPPRNLAGRHPGRLQSDHIAHTAHRKPLRRHPGPPSQSRKAGPYRSQKRPRHPGRHHPGMVGDIKSERWARSFRNGGRHRAESALFIPAVGWNQQPLRTGAF
ncbi:hypothetical protein ACVIGA_005500 [Bradyrhizobium sp. USDA 3240]